MARKKRETTFVCPGWRQALKARFLASGFDYNPDSLYQLATKVRAGTITVREWASVYCIAETWVEEWAQDTLDSWRNEPYLLRDLDEISQPGRPNIRYHQPRDEQKIEDLFELNLSGRPTSKLAIGIIHGGSTGDDEPDDDWLRFRKQMHASLDLALDQYRSQAAREGASREVILPTDLLRKTEVTAAYFFGRLSPEKILLELREKVEAPTTVYRWIKEILQLLDLPVRRSRPPKPPA